MLRVVGAGLGRTGTSSLKIALEQLLGAPCYHMRELHRNPAHLPLWHAAVRGEPPDWHAMLGAYRAVVDWPAASFWPELSTAFPESLILLSVRDPESWWHSAHATILSADNQSRPRRSGWREMWNDLVSRRFTERLQDREACIEAYNRHNEQVRKRVPPERLIEWCPGDGWEPLCRGLGLPLPERPFPHANSRSEFQDWVRNGGGSP
ncbi:MAG: sulfotransferase [Gammaproteobacteria bacterium]|jgi:hypothetical protein